MMEELSLPSPKPCFTIGAGHHIRYHKGVIGDPDDAWAEVVSVEGEVITVDRADGERLRFRHHETDRFALAVEWFGTEVVVRPSFLAVPHDVEVRPDEWATAHYLFGIATDRGKPLGRCLERDDPETSPLFRPGGAT